MKLNIQAMKIHFSTLFFCLLLCCCGDKVDNTDCCAPSLFEHFIHAYYDVDTLILKEAHDSNSITVKLNEYFHLGQDPKFEKYSTLFNDTGYAKFKAHYAFGTSITDTIESIHVYTNKKYNENHKENESLDDIIEVRYESARKVLESGYAPLYSLGNINDNYKLMFDLLRRKKLLSEFNLSKQYLVSTNMSLFFLEKPNSTGMYPLKIVYKETNGKVMENEIVVSLNGRE